MWRIGCSYVENRPFLCGEKGHSYVGSSELFSCEKVEGLTGYSFVS